MYHIELLRPVIAEVYVYTLRTSSSLSDFSGNTEIINIWCEAEKQQNETNLFCFILKNKQTKHKTPDYTSIFQQYNIATNMIVVINWKIYFSLIAEH